MKNLIIIIMSLFLMASCTQVPRKASYQMNYQEKMQASNHWNVLAKDIAAKIKFHIEQQPDQSKFGHIIPGESEKIQTGKTTVFISGLDRSPFGNAMRTFLTTELPKQLVLVTADKKDSGYEIGWEVQRVFHQADRISNDTSLLMGLVDFLQWVFIGGVDLDLKKPHSEIIVSFCLLKDNQYNIMRETRAFYVNDTDRNHYWNIAQNQASEIKLLPVNYTMKNKNR